MGRSGVGAGRLGVVLWEDEMLGLGFEGLCCEKVRGWGWAFRRWCVGSFGVRAGHLGVVLWEG